MGKEETYYFKCPETEEEKINDSVHFDTSIHIINLSFKEGNKWYVNDGQSSFYAIVEDESFLKKVKSGDVSFAINDILRVKIRREQFLNTSQNKLKTKNFIEEVKRHQKPPM